MSSRANSSSAGRIIFISKRRPPGREPGEDGTIFVSSSTQHPTRGAAHRRARAGSADATAWWCNARAWAAALAAKKRRPQRPAALAALAAIENRAPRARALQPRSGHDADRQAASVSTRSSRSASTTTGSLLAAKCGALSPMAAGRSIFPRAVTDRALFHLDNAYYIPERRIQRPRGEDESRFATPPSAASADRRACWSSRRSSTASRAGSGSRRKSCANAIFTTAPAKRTRRITARRSRTTASSASGTS